MSETIFYFRQGSDCLSTHHSPVLFSAGEDLILYIYRKDRLGMQFGIIFTTEEAGRTDVAFLHPLAFSFFSDC